MLSATVLATWIAFCIPTADPAIATALVMAGSGGNPALIADKAGQPLPSAALAQPAQEAFVGLTQIPAAQLRTIGVPPALALNTCTNLMLGWQLWSAAHAKAQEQEKTKWKAVSLAFSIYHDGQAALETPYSQKATDLAIKHEPVAPARPGSRIYNEVVASWANGQALLLRLESPGSLLGQAQAVAAAVRSGIE